MISQLRDGVRYLDIKLCRDKSASFKEAMIKSCNNFFNEPIVESLKEVLQFITESKKELVILDFSHFFGMSNGDHDYLAKLIVTTFKNKLVSNRIFDPTSSLNEIWKTAQRIIVIYNNDRIVSKSKEIFWPKSNSITYARPLVQSTHELFIKLSSQLSSRKETDAGFYALQAVLSPNDEMIAKGIIGRPSSALELGHSYNPEITNWISTSALPRSKINIIILDNYSSNEKVMRAILQQNTFKI